MAKKKTSAEMAREESEIAKVEDMLGDAFGSLGGLEAPTTEENLEVANPQDKSELDPVEVEQIDSDSDKDDDIQGKEDVEPEKPPMDDILLAPLNNVSTETISEESEENGHSEDHPDVKPNTPSGPPPASTPTGPPNPPSAPPNSPPSGPPSKGPPSAPPSGPPSGPPSPPSAPPSSPPSGPPNPPSAPPSGPPSKGPPSAPPAGPPPADSSAEEQIPENSNEQSASEDSSVEDIVSKEEESTTEEATINEVADSNESDNEIQEPKEDVKEQNDTAEEAMVVEGSIEQEGQGEQTTEELVEDNPESASEDDVEQLLEKEAEIARLSAEVERLRSSMAGAADVIEELENPPMPPVVTEDIVIGAHIVSDIARIARQLDRDELIRASMGTIAMLHPDHVDILVASKHMALLPRMNEKDICAGRMMGKSPRGAPLNWKTLEVLLASASIITGGPAAVIHAHGPYSTAVSCEKDLVLMQPIDEIGKKHLGKIIIVDPDEENPDEFLRQVAEALQQGGMRCVMVRGEGCYAVGADLDQAWANASMFEHSMKILLLARQANLKL